MSNSPAASDPGDGIASSTRSSSRAPSTIDYQFSVVTPFIIETGLEAAKARSRKRKADLEAEANTPDKRLKQGEVPKNLGGRPRKDKPKTPKQPSGPLILRKSKPVQAYVPPELWKLVLEHSSPALLLRAKNLNRNFYGLLTSGDQLSLWTTARKTSYGVDHPNPPAGISEIQYADLLEGQGCQARGCKSHKTRKTYWGFLRRWCESCLETKIVSAEDAAQIMHPYEYVDFMDCVPQAMRDSWNHYQWIGSQPLPRPRWAKYQKHARTVLLRTGPEGLDELKAKVDAFNKSNTDGSPKTSDELKGFFDGIREDMTNKIEQRREVENWEANMRLTHKAETQEILSQRIAAIEMKAAKMTPPISRADLEKLPCFKNAKVIVKPLTDRSWQELHPKLLVQIEELREREAREAEEKEAARIAQEELEKKRAASILAQAELDRKGPQRDEFGPLNIAGKNNTIPNYGHSDSMTMNTCTCPHTHPVSRRPFPNTINTSEALNFMSQFTHSAGAPHLPLPNTSTYSNSGFQFNLSSSR